MALSIAVLVRWRKSTCPQRRTCCSGSARMARRSVYVPLALSRRLSSTPRWRIPPSSAPAATSVARRLPKRRLRLSRRAWTSNLVMLFTTEWCRPKSLRHSLLYLVTILLTLQRAACFSCLKVYFTPHICHTAIMCCLIDGYVWWMGWGMAWGVRDADLNNGLKWGMRNEEWEIVNEKWKMIHPPQSVVQVVQVVWRSSFV